MTGVLLVSQAVLWLAVVVLGVITLALARQIGILYERIAPAGALALNAALKTGSSAPALRVEALDGRVIDVGTPGERARLYFFVSPQCPVCKTLLPVLRSFARDERESTEVVLASDGDADDHREFIRAERLERFPYVVSEVLGRSFGVTKLPYGVLVDASGKVASFGIVNSREHLESLLEARERGVASIQEYMNLRVTANVGRVASPIVQEEVSRAAP